MTMVEKVQYFTNRTKYAIGYPLNYSISHTTYQLTLSPNFVEHGFSLPL